MLKGCETPYTNVIFKYMDIKFNLGRECHLKNVHVYHTKLSYDMTSETKIYLYFIGSGNVKLNLSFCIVWKINTDGMALKQHEVFKDVS